MDRTVSLVRATKRKAHKTAHWLNRLGPNTETFCTIGETIFTNLDVRQSYVQHSDNLEWNGIARANRHNKPKRIAHDSAFQIFES